MQDAHQSIIEEIKLTIEKMVPMTPVEIVEKAQSLLKEVEGNRQINPAQLNEALVEIGRLEYPYRKAYHDLCGTDEEKRLRELVVERVDEDIREKLEEAFSYNLILDDFVKSHLFEEMDDEHRYQVTNAISMAEDVLEHQCDERAHSQKLKFEELVKKREQEVSALQARIDFLRDLARTHANHADELLATVERLEEGWSILSKDPNAEEIEKEIEYWQAILSDEVAIGENDLHEEEEEMNW